MAEIQGGNEMSLVFLKNFLAIKKKVISLFYCNFSV